MQENETAVARWDAAELAFIPSDEESALIQSVVTFAETARKIVISGPESLSGANDALREVATLAKGVDSRRKERTAPIDGLKREMMDYFRRGEDALKITRLTLEQQIQSWNRKQAEIQREQQRKANEAAEKERRRKEMLAEKAIARGDVERAVQHSEAAASVVAPIIAAAPTKAEGVSSRTYWHFEVIDPTKLQPFYLLPNEPAIQKVVDASKEHAAELLNGAIRVWSEERTVVRGTR